MTPTRTIAASKAKLGRTMALVGVIYCALIAIFTGCSPEKHYKTLSFFFDGVPDPNAPPVVEGDGSNAPRGAGGAGPVVFIHKPYAENKCDACHASAKKFDEFQKPDPGICLTCHQKELTKYPIMHGPVAVGECALCHAAHESTIPAMLKLASPQVCVQCHVPELLSQDPPEHLKEDVNCLDCHVAHGADKHGLLRKSIALSNPTTAPTPEASP